MDAANDPTMKVGVRDTRYPEAYYPYYNPELHRAPEIPKQRKYDSALNRYTAPVYNLDQKPYYGPSESFRVFNKPEVTGTNVKKNFKI